jgi:hypothetical protein
MKWRKIFRTEPIAVVETPDREEKSIGDRINAYELVKNRPLKVTYKREGLDGMVVTVIENVLLLFGVES